MNLFEHLKKKYEVSFKNYNLTVRRYEGTITVEWTITFWRKTRVEVFRSNISLITTLNNHLREISNDYRESLISSFLCSLESCSEFDHWDEKNPHSSFEFDEKCIGSFIELKDISL